MVSKLIRWLSGLLRPTPALLDAEQPTPVSVDDATMEAIRNAAFRAGMSQADSVAIINMMTKLGESGSDRSVDAVPGTHIPRWSPQQLECAHATGGIYRRLCNAPTADAARAGFEVHEGEEKDVVGKRVMMVHRRKVVEAVQLATAFRGAWIWPVTADGGDTSEPLGEGPHDVTAIHVFVPCEVTPKTWDTDPASPRWLQPETVRITPRRSGRLAGTSSAFRFGGQIVHTSRLIYVPGLAIAPQTTAPELGYQLSALDVFWPDLRALGTALQSAETMVSELSVPVFKLGARDPLLAGSDRLSALSLIRLARRAMSSLGMLVIGANDSVERSNASLTGWRDVVITAYEGIASVRGMPLTRLMGMAPAGLSSDDASGDRTYNSLLAHERDDRMEPILQRLYAITRGPNDDREIVWPAFSAPSAVEAADISLKDAQAEQARLDKDMALWESGLISDETMRERWGEDASIAA